MPRFNILNRFFQQDVSAMSPMMMDVHLFLNTL